MVTFNPALPDTVHPGDVGHVDDHNAIVAGLNALNSGKLDLSTFTAKGSLIIGTAGSTPGTLTIGTDNYVLIADATQATGVKWAQVPTAAIQDGAVTSAKIADGTIVSGDVAASTFAAFGTVGNLLTANQASVETDVSPFGAFLNCTISRSTAHSVHGSACLKAVATAEGPFIAGLNITSFPVVPGETITATFALKADRELSNVRVTVQWSSGGSPGAVVYRTVTATTSWVTHSLTVVVPPGVDTAGLFPWVVSSAPAGSEMYMDCFGVWKGAGGTWAMPGVPVVGQGAIKANGAVELPGGDYSPEGVVTANPGSTFLQTSGAATVTGMLSWRKATGTGNTGWVAEGALADTGWRKIVSWTSGVQDGSGQIGTVDTSQYTLSGTGYIAIRRIGTYVEWWIRGNMTKTNSGGHQLFTVANLIPSGFRADGGGTYGVSAPFHRDCDFLGTSGIGDTPKFASSTASVAMSWQTCRHYTADAWPTSLPGSAA